MRRMRLPMLAAVLLCGIFAGSAPGVAAQTNASPTADDVKQLDELRHGVVEAFNHRDVDAMLRYLDPNVVVVWQNGEVNLGPEAVRKFYNRMMVDGVVKSASSGRLIAACRVGAILQVLRPDRIEETSECTAPRYCG